MAGGNDGNLCNIPAIFIDSLSGSLIANAMIYMVLLLLILEQTLVLMPTGQTLI